MDNLPSDPNNPAYNDASTPVKKWWEDPDKLSSILSTGTIITVFAVGVILILAASIWLAAKILP